jgi:NADH-quinone oxidoreductase subunit C
MDAPATETEEPLALPGDGLREGIVDELRRRIGDSLVDVELRPNDDLWVRVATAAWAPTGMALRAMGFTYFCYLSALDWMPSPYGRGEDNPDEPPPERTTEIVQGVTGGATRFQMLARVLDPVRHVGVTVKADVPDDDLRMESWHTIWAGANWHERETWEMFGIQFTGHPDLRHIYLPGAFEGFPLRKDFPLLSRMIKPWPGIVDVEPMPAEEAEEAVEAVEAAPAEEPAAADAVEDATSAPAPPAEDEAASAPEVAADTAQVTDRTVENAPDSKAPGPEPSPELEDRDRDDGGSARQP